jgi:hypothetical protein
MLLGMSRPTRRGLPLLILLLVLAACGADHPHNGGATATATLLPTATAVPTANPLAAVCQDTGGSVESASCCAGAPDFPDTCVIGPCSCSPSFSRQVQLCRCSDGQCWNGSHCADRATPTVTAAPAQACAGAGGRVTTYECCADIGDFAGECGPPRTCALCGANGTATLQRCACASAGDCWNGSACVPDVGL